MKQNSDLVKAVELQLLVSKGMGQDLATVAGNTEQVRQNLHELKTTLTAQGLDRDEATRQLQEAAAKILQQLETLTTRLDLLQHDVTQGFRDDRREIRDLKEKKDAGERIETR